MFCWVFLVVVWCLVWRGLGECWFGGGFVVCFGGLFSWVGIFLFGFVGVFSFFYFKREVAREKGNLSKLFMCCLENGILSPLSAVLAGIHMCSHKSSTD